MSRFFSLEHLLCGYGITQLGSYWMHFLPEHAEKLKECLSQVIFCSFKLFVVRGFEG
jgi:hypothetical protein